jgi:hypothetical protein
MNKNESRARARKVFKLVEAARKYKIEVDVARRLDGDGREALAGLAGVRPPSDETWRQVVAGLEDGEKDPFRRIVP